MTPRGLSLSGGSCSRFQTFGETHAVPHSQLNWRNKCQLELLEGFKWQNSRGTVCVDIRASLLYRKPLLQETWRVYTDRGLVSSNEDAPPRS